MTSNSAVPGAPSPFKTLPNWRDLGYWAGADGKVVKPGVMYRTTEFLKTSDEDLKGVDALGLATIVDLRTEGERESCPDPVFADVGPLWLNILADSPALGGANPAQFADPSAMKQLTVDFAKNVMVGTYEQLVTSESALKRYSEFYSLLLAGDITPTAFHCTTGKDRTGWLAATFLSVLGVSRDDVYTEYLLTNQRLVPALQPLLDGLVAKGADGDALKLVLGVDKEYLDTAFSLVEKQWGDVATYFADGLGVNADAQAELRDRYLTASL